MVDPEKVRTAIRQRRETAEAALAAARVQQYDDWFTVTRLRNQHGFVRDDAHHIAANDPAAVIALCDGALMLLDEAEAMLGERDELVASFVAGAIESVAAMFGVSQEGGE